MPGSVLRLRVRKALGNELDLSLKRMATSVIADKMRLFELFTAIKDRAIKSKDDEAWNRCDECIQLWTKMVVADAEHEDCIVSNVEALQKNCAQITDDLHAALERLAASRSPSRRASRMGQDAAYMSQVHGQVRVMRVELDRMVGPPPPLPY